MTESKFILQNSGLFQDFFGTIKKGKIHRRT